MGTSAAKSDPRARDVTITDDELVVTLSDRRRIAVPLDWFPRLRSATAALPSAPAYGVHAPLVLA